VAQASVAYRDTTISAPTKTAIMAISRASSAVLTVSPLLSTNRVFLITAGL
jgi:hypothetical protein